MTDIQAASWLLSLAKEAPSEAKLIGVDISDSSLPKTYPSNVAFQIMSILDLPKEWDESFDFIHQRLLSAALSVDEWVTTIGGLFRVLKPGKNLQLIEVGLSEDVGEGPEYARAISLLKKTYDSRGLKMDCPLQIPRWLEQAGFTGITERRVAIPFGRDTGPLGTLGRSIMERTLRTMGTAVQQSSLVDSTKSWDEMMDKVVKEWEGQDNVSVVLYLFCARKPE